MTAAGAAAVSALIQRVRSQSLGTTTARAMRRWVRQRVAGTAGSSADGATRTMSPNPVPTITVIAASSMARSRTERWPRRHTSQLMPTP